MSIKKQLPPWLALLFLILLTLLLVVALLSRSAEEQQAEQSIEQIIEQVQREAAPADTVIELPEQSEPALQASGLALIVDDVGYDMAALRRILALPVPVAISIIPDAPFARESAELAHEKGQLVMLHLPMQPKSEKYRKKMTPLFLHEGMAREELRNTFLRGLANVPYAQGVNNHMGSYLSEQMQPMQWVMEVCREQGLFFIDSVTSNSSVAAKAAGMAGVSWASRKIFLDHNKDKSAMQRAWRSAGKCLEQEQRCIVIAHPYRSTLDFLEEQLGKQEASVLLSVKQLLHEGAAVHQVQAKPEVLL